MKKQEDVKNVSMIMLELEEKEILLNDEKNLEIFNQTFKNINKNA